MKNQALFISGSASTACNTVRECLPDGRLHGLINPALVIASDASVTGSENVKKIDGWKGRVVVIDPRDPGDFGERILVECEKDKIDLITQNGWMVMTPASVIARYRGWISNQHPGPLDPGFADFGGPGMHGKRVHFTRLHFVREVGRDFWSEATVQYVDPEFDKGELITMERVPILPGETPETLAERMLPIEHELQIEVLLEWAEGRKPSFVRSERLVRDGEEHIVTEGLALARKAYPFIPPKK